MAESGTLSAIKLALSVRELRTRVADADLLAADPVAIIGLGCRFPGAADSPEGYWRLLECGTDAISEVPGDRWDIDALYDADPAAPGRMSTRWGGFLDRVDGFDPKFFGIAPREAASMDPQQRLLLEVAWEALEDAGLTEEALAGSPTGVFVSVYNNDYALWQTAERSRIDAYTSLGTAHSIAAGRLSFLLDLQGPSLVVDTACSSSLVAVHLACQSLRLGESRVALAGGVSLILSPETAIGLSKWGFMAADGRCKTFDARADGFVRGEGCGVAVLKRLADALSDGDRVLAVIRGTAANQDGRSTVLTAPSGPSQEDVIRRALAQGRVSPADVTYVEAHGTGTSLGDPIEVEALAEVIGRPADGTPCLLGSVKTNIGHLEAAAGIAGLIKVVLSLQHERIPKSLHFRSLNPHVSLEGTRLAIAAEATPWPSGEARRFAGVSAFGFGGTNAHVVLEEPPRLPAPRSRKAESPSAFVLPLSSPNPEGLHALAASYVDFLRRDSARIEDICFTAAVRRTPHPCRLTVAGRSGPEMADALAVHLADGRRWEVAEGRAPAGHRPAPVFVFCGQGASWCGMARTLFAYPAFRSALDDCAHLIDPIAGFSLIGELLADEPSCRLHETVVAQPTLFAIQVALTALWRSWGVEPAAVVGHSAGEIAAAHVAGVLSLEDAARLVVHRARIMQRATGLGKMLAVRLSPRELEPTLAGYSGRLSMAVSNAPRSSVLSGDPAAIDELAARFQADGIRHKALPVNYAFHSYQMRPFADELLRAFAGVRPNAPALPMVSTVTGRPLAGVEADAEYWVRNVMQPVQFATAIGDCARSGRDVFVEIAPQPVLTSAIDECLAAEGVSGTLVASLNRDRPDDLAMAAALGELFVAGCAVAWREAIAGDLRAVCLPSYPWQRDRYWIDPPPSRSSAAEAPSAGQQLHPLLHTELRSPALRGVVYESQLSDRCPAFAADHRIHGAVVFPATGFIAMALAGAERAFGPEVAVLGHLTIAAPLTLQSATTRLQVVFDEKREDAADFRIVSLDADERTWTTHVTGQVRFDDADDAAQRPYSAAPVAADLCSPQSHYDRMHDRGCDFGPIFQGVRDLRSTERDVWAEVEVPALTPDDRAPYRVHPALLDACLQSLSALIDRLDDDATTWVPYAFGRVRLPLSSGPRLRVHGRVIDLDAGRGVARAAVEAFDDQGRLVAVIDDLVLSRTSRADMLRGLRASQRDWFYTVAWERSAQPRPAAVGTGRWLLFADRGGVGGRVAPCALRAAGHVVELVFPAGAAANGAASVDPLDTAGYVGLVSRAVAAPEPLRGVLHFWSLDLPGTAENDGNDVVASQERSYGSVLALARAFAGMSPRPAVPVWVFTAGAQRTALDRNATSAAQAPVWGLSRTIALEHPELPFATVDLDRDVEASLSALLAELNSGVGNERELALRGGERMVPRLVRATVDRQPEAAERRVRLEPRPRGVLENLALIPEPSRDLGPRDVEVRVEATGLNFRDVLNALGMYPGDPGPLGDECGGTVVRVGRAVTEVAPGDQVVGIAHGAFASHAVGVADLFVKRPARLSAAEAVTVPIAFLTADYALRTVARIAPGDRVLIHAAAGGVGLAAVQIAQRAGAKVFATAGSEEKRAYLRALGVQHVFGSRTLDFADEVRDASGGGVDVVLNSLTGEFIERSLSVLAPAGRFVEIGRIGIWDQERVRLTRPDVEYSVVFMGEVFTQEPVRSRRMLEDVFARIEQGTLATLPMREFDLADVVDAFRYVAQARHIGKVVVTQRTASAPAATVREGLSYLITGGLGALGLHVARWLVSSGARHLVLVGRRGPGPAADAALREFEAAGATVRVVLADVSGGEFDAAVHRGMEGLPPLGGIVHAAGGLRDGVLLQQDWERFAQVFGVKAVGAIAVNNLAAEAAPGARPWVVLFSSAASVLGSHGQANYAAANAFLDSYAWELRSRGIHAWSIDWGAWAESGMAASLNESDRRRLRERGHREIEPELGVSALARILSGDAPAQIGVMPVDWARAVSGDSAGRVRPFLSRLTSSAASSEPHPVVHALAEELAATPAEARRELLTAHVRDQVLKVLGLPASYVLDAHQGLRDVGLDSLMAVELKNRLQASVGRPLSATLAFDHPTVDALVRHLSELLQLETSRAVTASPAADTASGADELAALSDAEAETLLVEELAALDRGEVHGV